jgi:hypothetical protein
VRIVYLKICVCNRIPVGDVHSGATVQSNGFNSPSMVGINSDTVG